MDNFVLLGSSAMLSAQATIKIPKVYQPVKKSMYIKDGLTLIRMV